MLSWDSSLGFFALMSLRNIKSAMSCTIHTSYTSPVLSLGISKCVSDRMIEKRDKKRWWDWEIQMRSHKKKQIGKWRFQEYKYECLNSLPRIFIRIHNASEICPLMVSKQFQTKRLLAVIRRSSNRSQDPKNLTQPKTYLSKKLLIKELHHCVISPPPSKQVNQISTFWSLLTRMVELVYFNL